MEQITVDVDGSKYELVGDRSSDANAVYLDIDICEGGQRIALLKMRCAAFEPEYEMMANASVETLLEMAMHRGDLEENVRSALRWQFELRRINPEWGVRPIFSVWFPKNYEQRRGEPDPAAL